MLEEDSALTNQLSSIIKEMSDDKQETKKAMIVSVIMYRALRS